MRFVLAVLVLWCALAVPARADVCGSNEWLLSLCHDVSQTWDEGSDDLYLPLHAHHMRFAYTREKINSYREDSWGLGYGRSRYDADGNWHGLYGMAFLDSHGHVEPVVGYGYQWMWGEPQGLHAGVGYSLLVTAREDILYYTPIPGAAPIASINYGRASLNAAYIPGGHGDGNILFIWGRVGF